MRLLPLLVLLLAAAVARGGERPNVVLIVADDQGWTDFGFQGSERVRTPHLDALAGQGVVFPRGYVPTALCRPSLATLATGLWPHQHGIVGNDPPPGVDRRRMAQVLHTLDPLPARLARAGYRSLQTGKWWEGHWSEGGFTAGMSHGDPQRGGRHGDLGLAIGREGLAPIFDFVDACTAEGAPFLVWYAPLLPHRPHDAPERLVAPYRAAGIPEHVARYYAACEWFDGTVGELDAGLAARGLLDDTLVVFLADNGWIPDPATGGYAPRSKRTAYEGGVRTPLVLRWPARLAPARRDEVVSSIDVVPTVLAACGLAPDPGLPGRDLAAVARGAPLERLGVFGAAFEHDVADLFEPAHGLVARWTVQGRWKLIRPADRAQPSELYDVVSDPSETQDLALQELAVVGALRESLDAWWEGAVPRRPNVLLLLSDDQRDDQLGCAGHPVLRTPNLDALSERGVRFTNAFVTTSICAASRATLLVGRQERTHGFTFGTPPLADRLVADAWPAHLRAAGYRTGFVGKWGVRASDAARAEAFEWVRDREQPYRKPDGRHLTDVEAEDALEFLSVADPRPWSLWVSFHAPHAEDANPEQYVWAAAEDGLYDDVPVPLPALATGAAYAALPACLRDSEGRVRWGWRFDDEEKRARMTRAYWRMLTGVDRAVGRILAAVDERGETDDTLVVFTGDNGYSLGERGLAGKWTIYEESIRVPLLVFDPRLDPALDGRVLDPMVLNLDLPTTLLDLAGVPVPAGYEGDSLAPWLAGDTPPWRHDFLYEHRFDHPRIPPSIGVRGERFVYVRYDREDPPVEQLFDLWTDPEELVDLAPDPSFAEVLRAMRARCADLQERPAQR